MVAEHSVVGKSLPAVDAVLKVTGRLKFAGDIVVPGMLYAKVLHSPYAHARVLRINTTKAEALPGVYAVITHKNIPVPKEAWSCLAFSRTGPVLSEIVRFNGDEVAAVAAVNEETALKALGLIEVDYQELPAVFDIEEAIKPDAPRVRPDGNVRPPTVFEWGDLEKGFAQADFIIENKTTMGNQQHAPLDRNACIASWNGDQVTVWTSTQTLFSMRKAIANYLDMPLHKVRVVSAPTGGSFGFWWSNNFHFITVLLAKKAQKPVRLELTREEVTTTVKRREIPRTYIKLGVKNDGKLVAASYRHLFDNGAYGNKPDPFQTVVDLYPIPNVRFETIGISTNRVTAGCMRGVGDVTLGYGIEQAVDLAAEKLGMDPIEFRRRNHFKVGDVLHTSQEMMFARMLFPDIDTPPTTLTSSGLEECLNKGAQAIGWDKKWQGWVKPVEVKGAKRRGIGMALSTHISGVAHLGSNGAIVRVNSDGTAHLIIGVGRMGQGADTTQAQLVAEVLGIPLQDINVIDGDTDVCPETMGTVGSVTAHMVSPTTKAAAEDAKRQILEVASTELGVSVPELDIKDRRIFIKSQPDKGIGLRQLLSTDLYQTLAPPTIVGRGAGGFPFRQGGKMTMAHFVEVEVDTETGIVKVLKYVACHDSGVLINPAFCENQSHGGVFMGCGLALTESLVFDEETGAILNPNFMDYKILSALDLPDPETIFVEVVDPVGVYGAKGIGEGTTCCVAAAIVSAVHNAIGIRIDPPITPASVLTALSRNSS